MTASSKAKGKCKGAVVSTAPITAFFGKQQTPRSSDVHTAPPDGEGQSSPPVAAASSSESASRLEASQVVQCLAATELPSQKEALGGTEPAVQDRSACAGSTEDAMEVVITEAEDEAADAPSISASGAVEARTSEAKEADPAPGPKQKRGKHGKLRSAVTKTDSGPDASAKTSAPAGQAEDAPQSEEGCEEQEEGEEAAGVSAMDVELNQDCATETIVINEDDDDDDGCEEAQAEAQPKKPRSTPSKPAAVDTEAPPAAKASPGSSSNSPEKPVPKKRATSGRKKSSKGSAAAKHDTGPPDPRKDKYVAELQEVVLEAQQWTEEDRADYRLGLGETLEQAKLCAAQEDGGVPDGLVPLLARLAQGSRLPLSQLTSEVFAFLSLNLVPCVEGLTDNALQDKIRIIAERKCLGVKPKNVVVVEDTSVEAVWAWEVQLQDTYLPADSQSKAALKAAHADRKALGNHIKILTKLLEVLSKVPKNEASVSAEEEKLLKLKRDQEAAKQKQLVQKKKEEEKARAAAEKADKVRVREEEKARKEKEKADKVGEKEKRKREDGGAQGADGATGHAKKKAAVEPVPVSKSILRFMKPVQPPPKKEAQAAPAKGGQEGAVEGEGDRVQAELTRRIEAMDAAMKANLTFDDVDRERMQRYKDTAVRPRNPKHKPHRWTTVSVNVTRRAEGIWDAPNFVELEEKRLWNRMQFRKFSEDVRPPWWGTHCKRSRVVTGRRPFAKDTRLLDYEYDSEEDWEEEGDGESLSDTAMDDDKDPDDGLDYNDGWLARDDDVAGGEGGDGEHEAVRIGVHCLNAQMEDDGKPIVDDRVVPMLRPFRAKPVDTVNMPLPLCLPFYGCPEEDDNALCPSGASPAKLNADGGNSGKDATGSKKKVGQCARVVSEEDMPALLRLVDGSTLGKDKLAEQFLAAHPGPSKSQVVKTIEKMASKQKALKGRAMFVVHEAERVRYGLPDDPTKHGPTPPPQDDARDGDDAGAEADHCAADVGIQSPTDGGGRGTSSNSSKAAASASKADLKGIKGIDMFFGRRPAAELAAGKESASSSRGGDAMEVDEPDPESPVVIVHSPDSAAPPRAYCGSDEEGWQETKVSEGRLQPRDGGS